MIWRTVNSKWIESSLTNVNRRKPDTISGRLWKFMCRVFCDLEDATRVQQHLQESEKRKKMTHKSTCWREANGNRNVICCRSRCHYYWRPVTESRRISCKTTTNRFVFYSFVQKSPSVIWLDITATKRKRKWKISSTYLKKYIHGSSPNHAIVALNLTKNRTTRSEIIDLKMNLERASKLCSNFCRLPTKNECSVGQEKWRA